MPNISGNKCTGRSCWNYAMETIGNDVNPEKTPRALNTTRRRKIGFVLNKPGGGKNKTLRNRARKNQTRRRAA